MSYNDITAHLKGIYGLAFPLNLAQQTKYPDPPLDGKTSFPFAHGLTVTDKPPDFQKNLEILINFD
jgi:hypothetical protein